MWPAKGVVWEATSGIRLRPRPSSQPIRGVSQKSCDWRKPVTVAMRCPQQVESIILSPPRQGMTRLFRQRTDPLWKCTTGHSCVMSALEGLPACSYRRGTFSEVAGSGSTDRPSEWRNGVSRCRHPGPCAVWEPNELRKERTGLGGWFLRRRIGLIVTFCSGPHE